MLVLSRKPLEAVVVEGAGGFEQLLKVTVLEIKHGSVRLGFETTADVPVHRCEVWERIQNGGLPGNASGREAVFPRSHAAVPNISDANGAVLQPSEKEGAQSGDIDIANFRADTH